jgi:hypothetical protein
MGQNERHKARRLLRAQRLSELNLLSYDFHRRCHWYLDEPTLLFEHLENLDKPMD